MSDNEFLGPTAQPPRPEDVQVETHIGLGESFSIPAEPSRPEVAEPVGPSGIVEAQPIDETPPAGEEGKQSVAEYKLDPDFSSDGNSFMEYLKKGGKDVPTIDYASIWKSRKEKARANPMEAFDFLTSHDQAELREHLRPRSGTIEDDDEWCRMNMNVILRKFLAYTDEEGFKAIQDGPKRDLRGLINELRSKYKKSENLPSGMQERLDKLITVIKAEPEAKPENQAALPT